jgi:hypothetical protein
MNITDVTATVDSVPTKVPMSTALRLAIEQALTPPAPIVPAVVKTVINRQIAPATKGMPTLGYMIGKKGDQSLTDISFEGWSNGIIHQSSPGNLTLDNVRVLDSLGGNQEGHGIYADDAGQTIIRNSLLGWNGRPRNPPAGFKPNVFRHNAYFNAKAAAPLIENSIIIGAGNAGVQTRNPTGTAIFRNTVFIDNGVSLLNIMGNAVCEHCLFFGTQPYWDGTGWAGLVPVMNYWPVSFIDSYIVARSIAQGSGVAISSGGVWNHAGYPQFITPPAGPLVTAKDSVISGFVSPFGGPKRHDGSGFKTFGSVVTYDPLPLINKYLAGDMTAVQVIDLIQSAVRGQVR